MRVACALIRNLPVQLAILANPEIRGRPLVVTGSPRGTRAVCDVSEEGAAFGVRPGMSSHQAGALCPEAVFLPADEARCRQAMVEIADILNGFSPAVEIDGTDAYLDITGVPDEESLADEITTQVHNRTGLRCHVGISGGKFFARVAALAADGEWLIVPPGGERDFIALQPIDLLPASVETLQRLRYPGLRTIGQLTGFPVQSLVAQFGTDGARYHELANGIDRTPLAPCNGPATISVAADMEPPAAVCPQVLDACQAVLRGPLERIRQQGRACREVLVRLRFMSGETLEGVLRFKQPTVSIGRIQHRVRTWLEGKALPSPVVRLELEFALKGEMGVDIRLWSGATAPRQKALQVARDLKERFGHQPLKQVRELDPTARLPERRFDLVDVPE